MQNLTACPRKYTCQSNVVIRGGVLSNTLRTCPDLRDKLGKLSVIPDRDRHRGDLSISKGPGNGIPDQDGSAADQLVGGITAYLGIDR